jgi:hypothetical protein
MPASLLRLGFASWYGVGSTSQRRWWCARRPHATVGPRPPSDLRPASPTQAEGDDRAPRRRGGSTTATPPTTRMRRESSPTQAATKRTDPALMDRQCVAGCSAYGRRLWGQTLARDTILWFGGSIFMCTSSSTHTLYMLYAQRTYKCSNSNNNGQGAKSPYKINIKRCAIRKKNQHPHNRLVRLSSCQFQIGWTNILQSEKSFFISSAIIPHSRFPTYVLVTSHGIFPTCPINPSYQLWCKIFFFMVPFVRLGFRIRSSSEMDIKNVTAHD